MITYKQLTLAEIFEDFQNKFGLIFAVLILFRMAQNSLGLNRIFYLTYNLCSIVSLI